GLPTTQNTTGGRAMAQLPRVAIVTGASRGIGKACALALAEQGYDLAVCARTLDPGEAREHAESVHLTDSAPLPGSLHETAAAIRAMGRKALTVQVDLHDQADLDALVERTLAEFGRIDLLVNNARYVGPGHRDLFVDMPYSLLEREIRV